MNKKRPVPWYYWPLWMVCLALGLFIFYVLLTPVWMGIRFISWLAERRNLEQVDGEGARRSGATVAKEASERARDST
jgi:hypothetical protein